MYLFEKKNTIMVVGGMIFCHLLVGALCGFFIYKFLIVTYDASVFVLLSVLIIPLIICDTMARKVQAFSRFLVRCWMDDECIHCTCIGRKWCIRWDDIRVFGITGFTTVTKTGIVFLSIDPYEKYQENMLTNISNNRIVFSVNKSRWEAFRAYMPDDMKKKLDKAIRNACDCYFRY